MHDQGINTFCLYHNKGRTPMNQANNKVIAHIHVRYMSGICPVLVRYMSAFLPDIYRTYREHIADNDRRNIGATQELLYG